MYLIRDEYQNIQRTHNLTTKRQPDSKMGKGCFHKDIQMSHRHIKWCSTPLIISEMQIKTTILIISHLLEELLSKSLKITNVREDVEKRDPLCTVGENVSWYCHYEKKYGGIFKKIKNRATI